MPASPEATGGAGFTFEDSVVATYLTSLLVEGGACGLSEAIVDTISLQRAALEEPLDDLIIETFNRYEQPAKLSLQVKQSPILSAAETNTDFREVITASWKEFQKSSFRHGRDRVGLAAANIAMATLKASRTTLEWARASKSADDFFRRIKTNGFASDKQRKFVDDVRALLPKEAQDEDNTWKFLKHFVILVFDTLTEGASNSYEAIERLRPALTTDERNRAPELWLRLCHIARMASGVAGSFSRATLLQELSGSFDLSSAPSRRKDLNKIAEETKSALQSIRTDISGLVIPRNRLLEEIGKVSKDKRFIQLAGEAGSGKSAVLRAMAEEHTRNGFALVLTDKRLAGPGWPALATHLRLETDCLAELLLELSNSRNPTLFIDGIDRLGEAARQTVSDMVRTILDDPRLTNWRIVASTRSSHLEDLRVWLPSQLIQENQAYVIEVGPFNDTESEVISKTFPAMRELLFAEGAERDFARRPFFTEMLSRRSANSDDGPKAFSEIPLAQVWLEGGPHKAIAIERRRTLSKLAERCALSPDRTAVPDNLSPQFLSELLEERVITEVTGRGRYFFAHDIFLEWAVFGLCCQNGHDWPKTLATVGDRPGLIRVVELLSQFEFESGENWIKTQCMLEEQANWRHWSRVWLIAPFSSPLFSERSETISAFLADDGRLVRLLSSFRAHKTIENLFVLHGVSGVGEKTKFERLLLADLLSWPRPIRAWQRMLTWVLTLSWTEETVEDVITTFDVWLNLFQDRPDSVNRQDSIKDLYAKRLNMILADWDAYDLLDRNSKAMPLGFRKEELGTKLRQSFFRASLANTDLLSSRLQTWTTDSVDNQTQSSVFAWSIRLAQIIPGVLVDFAFQAFISPLPSEEAARLRDDMFGWSPNHHNWEAPGIRDDYSGHCYPASPLQQPFAALFEYAPQEGLRLVRQLLSRTVTAWRELPHYDTKNQATPIPIGIDFSWGGHQFWGGQKVYGWYRGLFSCDVIQSALMALEDWAFSELEAGRDPDAIVRDLVSGHESVATLGIALGILQTVGSTSPTAAALIGCQNIWGMDEYRWQHDIVGHHSNEMGVGAGGGDKTVHLQALRRINARPSHSKNIQWLATAFMLTTNDQHTQVAKKLSNFPNELPFTHEGQESDVAKVKSLHHQAVEWAAMADPSNYNRVPIDDGRIGVTFQPSEERVQRAEEAGKQNARWSEGFKLLKQAKTCFEAGSMGNQTRDEVLALAQKIDEEKLFSDGYDAGDPGSYRLGGVAAAAAAILNFGRDLKPNALEWAKSVTFRAADTVVVDDEYLFPDAIVADRPETFATKGLSAIIQSGDETLEDAQEALIRLSFHPYTGIKLAALSSAASCWRQHRHFADQCTALAFRLVALELDRGSSKWHANPDERTNNLTCEKQDLFEATQKGGVDKKATELITTLSEVRPEHLDEWRVKDFATMLAIIPKERFSDDENFRNDFISLLRSFVEKLSSAIELVDDSEHYSNSVLSSRFSDCIWGLVDLCEALPPEEVRENIIPILAKLPMEARSEALSSFANAYSCFLLLDAQAVPAGIEDVFIDIFDAVEDDPDWKRAEWRINYGLSEHLLDFVRVAMGANWKTVAMKASRFANNNWTDAALLNPLIDWMLNRYGHLPQVMQLYLQHVKRSFEHRSAEFLATRLGSVPSSIWQSGEFWSGGQASQLAALLQSFAEREPSMSAAVHQQFLEILGHLVEHGDRRASALQMSSLFDLPRTRV